MSDLIRDEHAQWQTICRLLLNCSAVQPADLTARVGATDSPGQHLLTELRTWGILRAEMGRQSVAQSADDMIAAFGADCPDWLLPEYDALVRALETKNPEARAAGNAKRRAFAAKYGATGGTMESRDKEPSNG